MQPDQRESIEQSYEDNIGEQQLLQGDDGNQEEETEVVESDSIDGDVVPPTPQDFLFFTPDIVEPANSAVYVHRPAPSLSVPGRRFRSPRTPRGQSLAESAAVQTHGSAVADAQGGKQLQNAGQTPVASWVPAGTSGTAPSSPSQTGQTASWTPAGSATSPSSPAASAPAASWAPSGSTSTGGGASYTPANPSAPSAPAGSSASGGTLKASQTADFTRALVSIQNSRRTAVGLGALQWDETLAASIRRYTQQGPNCSGGLKHSPATDRAQIGPYRVVGENLWKGSYEPTAQLVSDDWYNEKYCYRYGKIDPSAGSCNKDCSAKCKEMSPRAGCQQYHFTAYMWSSNTHIGCHAHQCPDGKYWVVGCQMGDAKGGVGGNMMGTLPFSGDVASRLGLSSTPCN